MHHNVQDMPSRRPWSGCGAQQRGTGPALPSGGPQSKHHHMQITARTARYIGDLRNLVLEGAWPGLAMEAEALRAAPAHNPECTGNRRSTHSAQGPSETHLPDDSQPRRRAAAAHAALPGLAHAGWPYC